MHTATDPGSDGVLFSGGRDAHRYLHMYARACNATLYIRTRRIKVAISDHCVALCRTDRRRPFRHETTPSLGWTLWGGGFVLLGTWATWANLTALVST